MPETADQQQQRGEVGRRLDRRPQVGRVRGGVKGGGVEIVNLCRAPAQQADGQHHLMYFKIRTDHQVLTADLLPLPG